MVALVLVSLAFAGIGYAMLRSHPPRGPLAGSAHLITDPRAKRQLWRQGGWAMLVSGLAMAVALLLLRA